MNLLQRNFKGVMVVCGVLTCTVFQAVIAPASWLHATFGESLSGPLAEIIVREFGALVSLVGLMLIFGAFNLAVRRMTLLVAATSKLVFIALGLSYGPQLPPARLGTGLVVDGIMVLLFAAYLLASRKPLAT